MMKKILVPLILCVVAFLAFTAQPNYKYGANGMWSVMRGIFTYTTHPTYTSNDSLKIADKQYVDDRVATIDGVTSTEVGNQIADSLAAIGAFIIEPSYFLDTVWRHGLSGDTLQQHLDTTHWASKLWVQGQGYGTGGGGVSSVTGTSNRITSTGGTTPVIDISSSWVGQASITTLGTVATGVWQGTAVATGYGGTGFTTYATGDMIYASATNTLSKLAVGTGLQALRVVGGVPVWRDTARLSGTFTQNATNGTFTFSNGNTITFGNGTTSTSGLLDTARARKIDSIINKYAGNTTIVRTNGFTGDTLNVSSGTYTPTASSLVNLSAPTMSTAFYMRSGNNVTVNGQISLTSTSSGVVQFDVSLPIASNLTGSLDAIGVITFASGVNINGVVASTASTDNAFFVFTAASGTAYSIYYQFQYAIK